MIYGLELKDTITLGVALYGASLSSFMMYRSWRKERKRVMLECNIAVKVSPDGILGEQTTSITVVNVGQRPVVVNAPQFQMPNKKLMHLLPGEGYEAFPKR